MLNIKTRKGGYRSSPPCKVSKHETVFNLSLSYGHWVCLFCTAQHRVRIFPPLIYNVTSFLSIQYNGWFLQCSIAFPTFTASVVWSRCRSQVLNFLMGAKPGAISVRNKLSGGLVVSSKGGNEYINLLGIVTGDAYLGGSVWLSGI